MSADSKVNYNEKFLTKMRDFNILTQNSILINFGMNFIIEIVNQGLYKNLEFKNIGCRSNIDAPPPLLHRYVLSRGGANSISLPCT